VKAQACETGVGRRLTGLILLVDNLEGAASNCPQKQFRDAVIGSVVPSMSYPSLIVLSRRAGFFSIS